MLQGGTREDAPLVSTAWLGDHLKDPAVRIIEVGDMSSPDIYREGHIPSALHWPWKESLWDDLRREFILPADFARLMGKSGIRPETTVVFYSNSAQFATYAFWVSQMRGQDNAKVLNGTRGLWEKEGHPLVRDIPIVEPAAYPIRSVDESSRMGREGVLAGLGNPDRVLLDLRGTEEYRGERVAPTTFTFDYGAERKGRIPGAKHLFYGELLDADGQFKPVEELRETFRKSGALPEKENVFYCRLSHRASLGWFAARYLLGFPRTKVYDGSWTEWGSIVGFPIEK